MKKLIFSVSILVFVSVLCSFSYNLKESKTGDEDEVYVLNPGQTAVASDGTSITASSGEERIRVCPGSGSPCTGTATIGPITIVYNSEKGRLRPDIIID